MRKSAVCALVVAFGVAARVAGADELQLRGGDRLSGEVVALQAAKLTYKTPFGELTVPWSEVAALRIDKPMLITVAGATPRLGTLEGIALADVVSLSLPQPALTVTGGAGAGWLATGGNTDINNMHLDGEVAFRRTDDRFTAGAVTNRAEDAGRQTARNTTVSLNYDRFLSERLFANGNSILTNDRFRGLDLRAALGAGLGYEVLKTPISTLSFEGGLGYVRENFAGAPTDSYAAAREAVRFTAFVVRKQVQVFHGHDGYFGLTGDDNLFFRMQNGVRFALAAGFASTVQIDLDYDASPAPGRKTIDRSTSFTLGYRF